MLVAAALATVACGTTPLQAKTPTASQVGDVESDASDGNKLGKLAPLESKDDNPLTVVEVAGFNRAVVSIPLGATSSRPVLVAVHGVDDTPEKQCAVWRGIVGDRGFVLCPRGFPHVGKQHHGFYFRSVEQLGEEIDGALASLHERFPGYVDDASMIYTGFSQGATFGVDLVARDPKRFPRVVLIEGGVGDWLPDAANEFGAHGGKRVLFACGLKRRFPLAEAMADELESRGIASKTVMGKSPGKDEYMHWYNGPVAEEIRASFAWVADGDGRWLDNEISAKP